MFPIPHIQMQTTLPKIEYDMQNASLDSTPAKTVLNYNKDSLKFQVDEVSPATFEIDQERAWEATGLGGSQFLSNQIYSESKNIVIEAIGKIVANGNRMAQITKGTVIHELHESEPLKALPFNYTGAASLDNVDVNVQRKQLRVSIVPSKLTIDSQKQEAQYQYTPHNFRAYLAQMNQLQITPPQLNIEA
jgi:hypothetical protein